ncbi:MAG: NAD(P)-dependent oxidoreductase [Microbacterium sp.]
MVDDIILVPSTLFLDNLTAPPGHELVPWQIVDEPGLGGLDLERVTMVVSHSSVGVERLALMGRMPQLRHVQTTSIGVEYIEPLVPEWAVLHNAAGVHEESTAEQAVSLTLAVMRRLHEFALLPQTKRWPEDVPGPTSLMAASLVAKRVLVLGYGGIGSKVGRRLSTFGCTIEGVGTRARIEDGVTVFTLDAVPSLLPAADVVIVALPLTDATARIVDAEFLSAMKDGAVLVNVGRGGLVDTDALVEALHTGTVRAGLDVTDPEPLPPDHPLWDAPNLLISPHVGGLTDRMWPNQLALIAAQIDRHAAGEPLVNARPAYVAG